MTCKPLNTYLNQPVFESLHQVEMLGNHVSMLAREPNGSRLWYRKKETQRLTFS